MSFSLLYVVVELYYRSFLTCDIIDRLLISCSCSKRIYLCKRKQTFDEYYYCGSCQKLFRKFVHFWEVFRIILKRGFILLAMFVNFLCTSCVYMYICTKERKYNGTCIVNCARIVPGYFTAVSLVKRKVFFFFLCNIVLLKEMRRLWDSTKARRTF